MRKRREILAARRAERPPELPARFTMPRMTSPLITAAELAAHLDDPSWVIVDCRFTLTDPAAGPAAYARSHIPGARYANLDEDLARHPGPSDGRHPLPRRERLRVAARRLGHRQRLDRRRLRRGQRRDRGAALVAARLARPRPPPRARRRLRGVERGAGCRSRRGRRAGSRARFVPRQPWPTTRSSRRPSFPRSRRAGGSARRCACGAALPRRARADRSEVAGPRARAP